MLNMGIQLQLQNNSEVPAWFPVDSRRYSIRLSGRPQYVRGSGKCARGQAPPLLLMTHANPCLLILLSGRANSPNFDTHP